MAITNEQLQEKLMDTLRAIESAEPATKELPEIRALKAALTTGKQRLDRVGPPPVIGGAQPNS